MTRKQPLITSEPKEPFEETVDVSGIIQKKCRHKNVEIVDGRLVCGTCGMSWGGARINELLELLKSRS